MEKALASVHSFVLGLICCWAMALPTIAADSARKLEEDDIFEVVFRTRFDRGGEGMKEPERTILFGKKKIFFLAINDKDPSAEFMMRFTADRLLVRKKSDGEIFSSEFGGKIVDKKTRVEGVLLSVGRVNWVLETKVRVKIGWHTHNMGSGDTTLTLQKQNGKWEVLMESHDERIS